MPSKRKLPNSKATTTNRKGREALSRKKPNRRSSGNDKLGRDTAQDITLLSNTLALTDPTPPAELEGDGQACAFYSRIVNESNAVINKSKNACLIAKWEVASLIICASAYSNWLSAKDYAKREYARLDGLDADGKETTTKRAQLGRMVANAQAAYLSAANKASLSPGARMYIDTSAAANPNATHTPGASYTDDYENIVDDGGRVIGMRKANKPDDRPNEDELAELERQRDALGPGIPYEIAKNKDGEWYLRTDNPPNED